MSKTGGVTLIMRKKEEAVKLSEVLKTVFGGEAAVSRPVIMTSVLLLDVPK